MIIEKRVVEWWYACAAAVGRQPSLPLQTAIYNTMPQYITQILVFFPGTLQIL